MSDSFADRFDTARYVNEQPVRLFRPDRYGPQDDEAVSVPEPLWHRIRLLGTAYNLHLLPVLDGTTDPVFLSDGQVEQLLDELRFVGTVVDDPLVDAEVRAILAIAQLATQGASKHHLGIEFP